MSGKRLDQVQVHDKSWLALGTIVRIQLVTQAADTVVTRAFEEAIGAIHAVESACSRFDSESELVQLIQTPAGRHVQVSPILFQTLQFAVEVAKWTDGKFDPSIGARMETLGFNRHYLTGESVDWQEATDSSATFRDIELNPTEQTVCLQRPMKLDLGAVAKGLAVDLAVQHLKPFELHGSVVDAGGDLYASGVNGDGEPWEVGIRHPMERDRTIYTLSISDAAVCTSGTYERRSPLNPEVHHLLNAQSQTSAAGLLSGTAVGPVTMMADALSTAAFLYPPGEAISMLAEAGLEGIFIAEDMSVQMTVGMERYLHERA